MSEYVPEHRSEDEEPVVGDAPPHDRVLLSNTAYDVLKRASLYLLPALAAAYFGLAQIWDLPKAEEVVGSVVVLETLIGVIMRIATGQYENSEDKFDGAVVIRPATTEDGDQVTDLNVQLDPQALVSKKEILVKVDKR